MTTGAPLHQPTGIDQLLDADATACAAAIRSGDVTAVELAEASIARITERDPQLNAMSWDRFDAARSDIAAGLPDGPFAGVPFLLKDLEAQMIGEPSYDGNALLRSIDYRSEGTSELVTRFQRAGFVILGGAMSSEFGTSALTEPADRPPVSNPWALGRNAGGSSGGPAAAVAGGMVPCAHASDGGGSTRIPASFCGLVGLKPSRGRVSGAPLDMGAGPAAEHVVTRSVRDCAAILDAISGPAVSDSIVAPAPGEPFLQSLDRPLSGLRIGVMTSYPGGDRVVDPALVAGVEAAANVLAARGHHIEIAHPPIVEELDWLIDVFYDLIAVSSAGAAAQMEAFLDRPVGPGDMETVNLAMAKRGSALSAGAFMNAFAALNDASVAAAQWWSEGFDLLLQPVTARRAPLHGEMFCGPDDDGIEWFNQMCRAMVFTAVWNLTGQPAIAVPSILVDGMPTSAQLIAPYGREDLLLGVARQLEVDAPWALVAPR